jgi:choline dehydrogenase-like flavoprotein
MRLRLSAIPGGIASRRTVTHRPPHICVVGAGLGGGVIASTLAARGFSVRLIEQGTTAHPSAPADEDWEGGFTRSTFSRGEGIGGTSNYWHAGLMALDRSDVEGTSPGSADANYPLSFEELCAYYRGALSVLTTDDISLDDLLSCDARQTSIAFDRGVFRLKQLFFPSSPFSTSALIADAVRMHGLEVVTGFRAERMIFHRSSRATHVEGTVRGRSDRSRIAADLFILCAGGIGSPKILLGSADANAALRDLPIGRFLIDHPTGFVFKAKLKRRLDLRDFFEQPHGRRFRKRWGFALRPEHLHVAAERNHVVYLRPAVSLRNPVEFDALKRQYLTGSDRSRIRTALRMLGSADLLLDALNFRYGLFTRVHFVSGYVLADQAPTATNRITLDRDRRFKIRWDVSVDDAASLRRFLDTFVARHAHLFERVEFFGGPLASAAHHSGGCRMAACSSDGVVDRDLRVFGTDNLYVADGSVLPYAGHANTGLTIAALALKCADAVQASVSLREPA